jgi:hypothetical protein
MMPSGVAAFTRIEMRKLNVTILITGEGIEAAKTEIAADLSDEEDVTYASNWLMYWLSVEARVENTWLDHLKKLPEPNAIAANTDFSVSFTTKGRPAPYFDNMNQ